MYDASSRLDGLTMQKLKERIPSNHLRLRLGIEQDHEKQIIGQGRNLFHLENWYSIHHVIRGILKTSLLYDRGRRNAVDIRVEENLIAVPNLPTSLDNFTILHLSDLHLDMHPETPHAIINAIRELDYDVCVITGDFRAQTYGDVQPVIDAMSKIRPHFSGDIYAVLGNHDSIQLVPGLEDLDIKMLLNESTSLQHGGNAIYLAGVDDPHYYRTDNLEATCESIPDDAFSLLLSHSPELYRHAAHAGFNVMLSGHTHGGQICLPGGIPLYCNMRGPRYLCRGAWQYGDMRGYTSRGTGVSVVEVRLNCPPEITLHRLCRSAGA